MTATKLSFKGTMGQFSNFALDQMATNLSQFTNPEIPELSLEKMNTLQVNMLESVVGVFSGNTNAHVRHLMTDMVRRIFSSIETYRIGRENAVTYVEGNRHKVISPYFRSLTGFECCIAYSWQVCDWLNFNLKGQQTVYVKGDGSAWERLNAIYRHGTKHAYGKYDKINQPEIPTAIWLKNDGISCITGDFVTYQELSEIIVANNQLFYDCQDTVRAKLKEQNQRKSK